MFGFLKDKLKGALGKLTKEVEKDAVIEKKEVLIEKKSELISEKKKEIKKEQIPVVDKKEEKRGFFSKIFGKKETEDIIEDKEELLERAEHTIRITKHKPKTKPVESSKKILLNKVIEVPEYKPEPHTHTKGHEHSHIIDHEHSHDNLHSHTHNDLHEHHHEEHVHEHPREELHIVKENILESKVKPQEITKKEPKIEPVVAVPRYKILEEERSKKTVEKPAEEEKKGFFTKITETFTKINITEEKFEELFWDLEVVMLENNVAVEVIEKIKRDLKKELMNGKVSRKGVEELILSTLKQSVIELFDVEKIDLISRIKDKRKSKQPYIITIIGVNGAGKTTSIAKLTHKFQKEGLTVVWAASDTFRAAAIQQLEEHANKLNVKMIKHDYNSDPAAVAFDAIKYAEAKNIDVVMIDTAGRLHSNTNLMRELEKVIRVCKPDIKIFVGESITGNDCVEQAKEFDKAVGIDAIILAKADVDDKGGAAISVSYILKRPILYLGTGQTYDDLKEFDSKIIIESLEL